MKKFIIYIIVIASALIVPVERADVGKLIPVETVFVYREGEMTVVETETGNRGVGSTVDTAIQNLHETASGLIFLDTAEYLLVSEETVGLLSDMAGYLKETTRVCKAEPGIDLMAVSEYLAVHRPSSSLKVANTMNITEKIEQNEEEIKIS